MREKIEWFTISNPRKENGDLGDLECNVCGCNSGAYITLYHMIQYIHIRICKGCLCDGIDKINDAILSFE